MCRTMHQSPDCSQKAPEAGAVIVSIFTCDNKGFTTEPKIPGQEAQWGSDPGMWTPESASDTISLGVRTFGERIKPIARANGLLKQVYTCVLEAV